MKYIVCLGIQKEILYVNRFSLDVGQSNWVLKCAANGSDTKRRVIECFKNLFLFTVISGIVNDKRETSNWLPKTVGKKRTIVYSNWEVTGLVLDFHVSSVEILCGQRNSYSLRYSSRVCTDAQATDDCAIYCFFCHLDEWTEQYLSLLICKSIHKLWLWVLVTSQLEQTLVTSYTLASFLCILGVIPPSLLLIHTYMSK